MRGLLFAAAAAASLVNAGAALASPREEMCEWVAILATKGVDAAMHYTEKLAGQWPPEERAKLGVVVGAELQKFSYIGGQVYQIAELPGAIEEYFLTLNLKGGGSVYLRVLYEGNGGPLTFININLKSSYYEAIDRPFLQEPKPVPCS